MTTVGHNQGLMSLRSSALTTFPLDWVFSAACGTSVRSSLHSNSWCEVEVSGCCVQWMNNKHVCYTNTCITSPALHVHSPPQLGFQKSMINYLIMYSWRTVFDLRRQAGKPPLGKFNSQTLLSNVTIRGFICIYPSN